jgi:predicted MFS family arabinose efflux permease
MVTAPSPFVFAVARVAPHDRGAASGTATLVRSLGGAIGVAAGGAFFGDGASVEAQLDATNVAAGSAAAFLLCAAAGIVVLVAALFIREIPDEQESGTAVGRGAW